MVGRGAVGVRRRGACDAVVVKLDGAAEVVGGASISAGRAVATSSRR